MSKLIGAMRSRTRVIAVAVAVLAALKSQGVVKFTPEQWQLILEVAGAGGLYTLRAAIDKVKQG